MSEISIPVYNGYDKPVTYVKSKEVNNDVLDNTSDTSVNTVSSYSNNSPIIDDIQISDIESETTEEISVLTDNQYLQRIDDNIATTTMILKYCFAILLAYISFKFLWKMFAHFYFGNI